MKTASLRNFVLIAMFTALIWLLGLTPLGMIPLGFIHVTILCVPVLVGTLLLGRKSGLILGLMFGAVSLYTAITRPSTLVGTLMAASPAAVVAMSMIPRLCVPLTALATEGLLRRHGEKRAAAAAAAVGSLTNTVLYLGMMLLFYVVLGLDQSGVFKLIGGVALIAGSLEAAAAALLTVPILYALRRLNGARRKSA